MKYPFLLLLMFLGNIHLLTAHNKVYVVISPTDCENCVAALEDIKNIADKPQVFFVMPSRSILDSDAIFKMYGLESAAHKFYFRDSMFNEMKGSTPGKESNIIIHNSLSQKKMSIPMMAYSQAKSFIDDLLNDTVVYTFEQQIFGSNSVPYVNRGAFYIFDEYRQNVLAFDMKSRQLSYEITIDDTVNLTAYKYRFRDQFPHYYNKLKGDEKTGSKWKKKTQRITCVQFHGRDTVSLLVHHPYSEKEKNSINAEIINGFLSKVIYKNGALMNISVVENYSDPTLSITPGNHKGKGTQYDFDEYTFSYSFIEDNKKLYMALVGSFQQPKKHFLGRMKLDTAANIYLFDSFYTNEIDDYYFKNNTYDNIGMSGSEVYDAGFVMQCMGDRLHHLESGRTVTLEGFNDPTKEAGNFVFKIKYTPTKLFMIGGKASEHANYYFVYDLIRKKLIFEKKIIGFSDASFITSAFFDDFDYSIVYLPTDARSFKKVKMYNP